MKKILLIALMGLVVANCGNDAKKKSNDSNATEFKVKKKHTTEKETKEVSGVNIGIGSNDLMQFDKKTLRVKAGKTVTLTLRHTGKMPKNVMGHNFVLLKRGVDMVDFAIKAMNAADTDYIPEGDDTIAYTKIIGGGESATISFRAPAKGSYDFLCSFPGHYAIMNGKFIVE